MDDEWEARAADAAAGESRYNAMVALARSLGVVTPEDPYPIWPAGDRPIVIAPLFLLYDYTFRPDDVGRPMWSNGRPQRG